MLLGLTILEHHTGCFQRGGNVRWGLFDARTDPTADLYGWDLVAERLEELGISTTRTASSLPAPGTKALSLLMRSSSGCRYFATTSTTRGGSRSGANPESGWDTMESC